MERAEENVKRMRIVIVFDELLGRALFRDLAGAKDDLAAA